MKLTISDAAIQTFQEEWGFQDGQQVRIYAKYAGGGSDAFSAGINMTATPIDPAFVESIGGYHFFVEKSDEWIVKDKQVKIDSNQEGIFLRSE
ncbi:Fe-S cluster assembly protein HesB [Gorillibacterium sp. CAU 1737]|uniref:HesB/YadR/YfhF family protein n=1 Tax=Gorillibacterium sp. CAU 1737 TaxID=3140362 RepID=UPI003260EA06